MIYASFYFPPARYPCPCLKLFSNKGKENQHIYFLPVLRSPTKQTGISILCEVFFVGFNFNYE